MADEVSDKTLDATLDKSVERYKSGKMDRRELLKAVIALTGSYTTAHLLLESTGVSANVISPLEAQAAGVDAETIKYPSGSIQVEGYLAKPTGTGKFPAVIVIHENRGLNEHIRDVARRFAAEGFVALAPDLLSRLGGTASMKTVNEATAAFGRLPVYDALGDLREGHTYLSKHALVDPQKVSVLGFCWGGWRSFMLGTQVPELHRVVVFYGTTPDRGLENIKAPVLAHYASRDRAITGNSQWTAREMKKLGKQYTFYIYDNTDHAFFNETNGPRHNPEAAKLAWSRTVQFLKG
jgi:carboxymethylenebutenolidase